MSKNLNKTAKEIEELFLKGKYKRIVKIIESIYELIKDDHWFIAILGQSYYELRDYKKSLEILEIAYNLQPSCPLVRDALAFTLRMLERDKEAIEIWEKLLSEDFDDLAYGECHEGKRWTLALLNDIKMSLSETYFYINEVNKAEYYIKEHLKNRKRGQRSIRTQKEALKLEKEINEKIKELQIKNK